MLGIFSCFDKSNGRGMERFDIMLMVGKENFSSLAMRTFLSIQEIIDLVLAPMEWILSERWGTHTVPGQLLCQYTIFFHGCATREKYLLLMTLKSGPKQGGIDIDAF
jgi:hypothetical protein